MIVRGVVTAGQRLGRELGFPTANITIEDDLPIQNGVYRSFVRFSGESYLSISNVGYNPTVGVTSRRVESYIFDFEGDLYGVKIEVELLEKIRDEIKFETLEALKAQIEVDIERVKILEVPIKQ